MIKELKSAATREEREYFDNERKRVLHAKLKFLHKFYVYNGINKHDSVLENEDPLLQLHNGIV